MVNTLKEPDDFDFCGVQMSRGGWRFDAGRPAMREVVEDYQSIDVRAIARAGLFASRGREELLRIKPGRRSDALWVHVQYADDRVRLLYDWVGRQHREDIEIDRTPCHFGGARLWFLCPRCGVRSSVLHLKSPGVACRACHGLVYRTQRLGVCGRSWTKQRKIERMLTPNFGRPKRMSHARYARLIAQLYECLQVRGEWLSTSMGSLMPTIQRLQARMDKIVRPRMG